jgi:uncharacterized protein (DUF2267 family)
MVPVEYLNATRDFDRFLRHAVEASGLVSINQAYTMVQGVLQTFRRRLTVAEAILFASVLPAGLRALFVADWDVDEPRLEFGDVATMTAEVQALRALHNFSPPTAIHDVAVALRRNVIESDFEAVLAKLPEGASEFWRA